MRPCDAKQRTPCLKPSAVFAVPFLHVHRQLHDWVSGALVSTFMPLDNTHIPCKQTHAKNRKSVAYKAVPTQAKGDHARSPGGNVAGRSARWLLASSDSRRMASIRDWTRRSRSSCAGRPKAIACHNDVAVARRDRPGMARVAAAFSPHSTWRTAFAAERQASPPQPHHQ